MGMGTWKRELEQRIGIRKENGEYKVVIVTGKKNGE